MGEFYIRLQFLLAKRLAGILYITKTRLISLVNINTLMDFSSFLDFYLTEMFMNK